MAKRTKRRPPQGKNRTVGWAGLAQAVLLRAVQDATAPMDTEGRRGARRFFQDKRMLGIYCELAEWDADYIRQNVERLSNGQAG